MDTKAFQNDQRHLKVKKLPEKTPNNHPKDPKASQRAPKGGQSLPKVVQKWSKKHSKVT